MHTTTLSFKTLPKDPLILFKAWYKEANTTYADDPERAAAMALSTADENGTVDVRFVLLKGIEPDGFLFYTDYTSSKGHDLTRNPHAAVAFYWHELHRQVRIRGRVKKIPDAASDAYFSTRPKGSQIATIAYAQSRRIPLDHDFTGGIETVARKHAGQPLPRPSVWGGYRIVPRAIEFWQAGRDRLHTRFVYRKEGAGWHIVRLTP